MKANMHDLFLWGSGQRHGRFDYDTDEHSIDEILTEEYFSTCLHLLRPGDYIYVTDCNQNLYWLRVDDVLHDVRKVRLSLLEAYKAKPAISKDSDIKATYRWRGRGGGHSIVDLEGDPIAVNFGSKEDAERALNAMIATGSYIAPVGHEPQAKAA